MVFMKLKVRKAASWIVGWAVGRSAAASLVAGLTITEQPRCENTIYEE